MKAKERVKAKRCTLLYQAQRLGIPGVTGGRRALPATPNWEPCKRKKPTTIAKLRKLILARGVKPLV